MRLSSDDYEFIKGEVVALFERYDVRCIPISGVELANKMGIKLIQYSAISEPQRKAVLKLSTDGFYIEDRSGADIICYNDGVPYERMNMTLLHEIGHCVLDHLGGSEKEEAEANFFAKYAAAPPPLIHRITPACPDDIAYAFCISYEASVYAMNYYHKWLRYGEKGYTEYEIRLLDLFKAA